MLQSTIITLTLCLTTITAQASLLGRAASTPGGTDYQAYYDDALNITWLADAKYSATESFGVNGASGANGGMNWYYAQDWLTAMNAANHLGVSEWRLPAGDPVDGIANNYRYSTDGSTDFGYNISAPGSVYAGSTANEMAHLFYNTLGNPGYLNIDGSSNALCQLGPQICLYSVGPFSNLSPPDGTWYWSSGGSDSNTRSAFYFREGIQDGRFTASSYRAWAVHNGDPLAPVPIPAAVWLFGSALGVMGWMRRRAA